MSLTTFWKPLTQGKWKKKKSKNGKGKKAIEEGHK
jgi:hypothetical protein